MIDLMIEALTGLRMLELEDGAEHPADLPREELVDRLTQTDTLVRGGARTPAEHQRRAGDLNTIAEARARLAFVPGAENVLGVRGKHRGKREIVVGSRVRISGKFLRNTGQYFKCLENDDQGTVVELKPFSVNKLATVQWDRYALPGGEKHLSECVCEGDERPTCAQCSGTGRRYQRILSSNLELLPEQFQTKMEEEDAPW